MQDRPNIYYFVPYDGAGIGVAYNRHCALVPDDAWCCVMDADLMLFPSSYGVVLEAAITSRPEVDVWTTAVTRVTTNAKAVCPGGRRSEVRDLTQLKKQAMDWHWKHNGVTHILPVGELAGYFLLFRKTLWLEHPFPVVAGSAKNLHVLGVDTEWSSKLASAGKVFGLVSGLLAVHYYTLGENRKEHTRMLERGFVESGHTSGLEAVSKIRPRIGPPRQQNLSHRARLTRRKGQI